MLPDIEREIKGYASHLEKLETGMLLSGEHDHRGAIVTIHPGAGGTESQDWAEMLLRMYLRWSERRGFKREVMDYQPGEEAGIKSATVTIIRASTDWLMFARNDGHRPGRRLLLYPAP